MKKKYVFNRVQGLKFLYENFPSFYRKDRIELYFVSSKSEPLALKVPEDFDTLVLKRSANKTFISDIKFKDNRFFKSFDELKVGSDEFQDIFDFCVECHRFKTGESYYTDRLAIAQFSTKYLTDTYDRINFIPSRVPGVNTRENMPYLEVEFHNNFGSMYNIKSCNQEQLYNNGFTSYSISFLVQEIHKMIDRIRDYLIELGVYDDFQLIIRIDGYLNLLPIDFRTPNAWAKVGG